MQPDKKSLLALKTLKDELNQCFKWGKGKVPISIGIHHDVLAHYQNDTRFSKTNLRKAIGLYTSSSEYLEKVIEGTPRINLMGKTTTYVTREEEDNSRTLLLKKRKKVLLK